MNTAKKIIASLIAGAAIGVVAGILLAPDKGAVTRAKLKAKGKDWSNRLKGNIPCCHEKSGHTNRNKEEYV